MTNTHHSTGHTPGKLEIGHTTPLKSAVWKIRRGLREAMGGRDILDPEKPGAKRRHKARHVYRRVDEFAAAFFPRMIKTTPKKMAMTQVRDMIQQLDYQIVELLIVIVVIAILAAISVVAYNTVQQSAKVAKANSDLAALNKAIQTARVATNKNLRDITGSNCSACGGSAVISTSLDSISAASGANLSALKSGDPWGNFYRIDENEGEGATPCANRDALSINPSQSGVSLILVPFYTC